MAASAAPLLLLGSLLLPARVARAEMWSVVPAVIGDGEGAQLSAARARDAVHEALGSGTDAMPPARARERFESRGSSQPVAATHSDLDAIADHAQKALYHTASGLVSRASQDVERLMEHAEGALESLNRETQAARQLLDACMFSVRGLLENDEPDRARAQALECRRLVPDLEPSADMHPPHVIGEYAAAGAALEMQKPGSLRITSDPTGCPVFVQGRKLGKTPLDLPQLSHGDYRIQVECIPGEFARVHRVAVGQSHIAVHVDSRFDAAVRSSDGVSLRYGLTRARRELALGHASQIGRILGTSHVLLLAPDDGGPGWVRAWALETRTGEVKAQGLLQVDEKGQVPHARAVIFALREGRSLDGTGTEPRELAQLEPVVVARAAVEADSGPGAADPDDAASASQLLWDGDSGQSDHGDALAWTAGGIGLAGHLAGWALYGRLLSLEDDYRKVRELSDASEAQRRMARIESFELVPLAVAGGGTLIMTVSLPFLLPSAEPGSAIPTWSIVVGASGLAAAGVGTALLVQGADCSNFDALGRCDDKVTTTRLGALIISTGVPLLALPIIYGLRGLSGDDSQHIAIGASPDGFNVTWGSSL